MHQYFIIKWCYFVAGDENNIYSELKCQCIL